MGPRGLPYRRIRFLGPPLRGWSACLVVSASRLVEVVVGDGVVVASFDEEVVEALRYDLVFIAVGALDCADVVGELADVAGAAEGEVAHPQFGVGQRELALTIGQGDLGFGHLSRSRAPVSMSSAATSLSLRLEFWEAVMSRSN